MTHVPSCRLHSDWNAKTGSVELTVEVISGPPLEDAKLATTSLFRIRPDSALEGARLVEQLSNYHVFAQIKGTSFAPGDRWVIRAEKLSHVLRHYTYGPKSAFLILPDGSAKDVEIMPMTKDGEAGTPHWETLPAVPLPENAEPLSVLPRPLEVRVDGVIDPEPGLMISKEAPRAAGEAFSSISSLATRLFPEDAPCFVDTGGRPVAAIHREGMPEEGYRIDFSGGEIAVAAGSATGFRYGFITLGQILRGARKAPESFRFPETGTIADEPRFGWRGQHLDVARQFYRVEDILDLLDCMAWNKLNRFHFHLNDDEAWRLEIPGFPELTERAAWRGLGEMLPPLLGSSTERSGGFYTSYDIRRIVQHADDLGIEIIPEIDVPGHCHCVLEALPQLRDPGETGTYSSVQYFPNNALNPAMEESWTFLAAVFDQLTALFPGPFVHAGADEVADGAWMGSPKAVALGERLHGRAETFALQSYFLKRVQEMLRERGRGTGVWEEAALGGGLEQEGALLFAWKKSASGRALAGKGYEVVLTPAEHYYFDIARSTEWWEPGASWAGTVTLADTYNYDPGSDWPAELRERLVGVQSCLWSENLALPGLFRHLVYPRISAMAEGAWCAAGRKDYSRFLAIQGLMPQSEKS